MATKKKKEEIKLHKPLADHLLNLYFQLQDHYVDEGYELEQTTIRTLFQGYLHSVVEMNKEPSPHTYVLQLDEALKQAKKKGNTL
jgi:hypothetical protein